MPVDPISSGKITVQELRGLNQREQNAQSDLGYFDILKGAIPVNKNTLSRANGCKLLQTLPYGILSIYQTNDSRNNIIIQTTQDIRIMSEGELFNIPDPITNLIPSPNTEEESMSRCVIAHYVTAGTNGGTYTTANTWQQAPLTGIIEQRNPDGTAASFATFATNQITLAAGIYRIKGWSVMSVNAAGNRGVVRLYNVTAATAAWSGLPNEVSTASTVGAVSENHIFPFGGYLDLTGGGATFEIQGYLNAAKTNSGFGIATNSSPFLIAKEYFREIEIYKTA